MSIIARQSTARTVTVGPVLDADGVAVTGGVVGDFKISKNGAAPAALNASATLTHRHTGHYSLALTATDLDTVGSAEVVIDDTVNACPIKAITVIEEAVYDALFAASAAGYGTLDAAGVRGAVGLASANLDTQLADVPTVAEFNARTKPTADYFDWTTDQVIVVTNNDKTGYALTTLPTIPANWLTAVGVAADVTTELQSGLATAAALSTAQTDLTAILADTNELQTDWVNGGRLDLILDARASQASVDVIDGIVDDILVDTAAIPAFPANFAALGINASGHVSRVTLADTLTTYTGNTPQTADHTANIAAILDDTGTTGVAVAAASIDLIWDEPTAGHATAGTTGKALTDAGSAGNPWSSALSANNVSGTFGELGNWHKAALASSGVYSVAALANAPAGGGGAAQPRINLPPSPFSTIRIDPTTHRATPPIRLTSGAVGDIAVFIDMSPLFGHDIFVETVGAPTISGGSIVATELGPRDTYAVVELTGTATAGEAREVSLEITMESGETITIEFDITVFAD